MQPRSSSLFVAVFLMFLISATMARVWSRKPTEDEDSSAPKESSAPQDSKSDHNDKHDHGRPAHDSKDKEKEKDKGNKNQTTAEDPVPEHTNDDDVFSNPFSEEQASRIKARREQRRREAPAEEKKKPASGTQDGSPIVDPFVPRDADASGEAEAQEDGSDYESSDDHWASNPFESQRHRNNTKSHQKHKGSSSQPGQPDPDPIAGDGDGGDKDKSGKSVVGAGDGEEELESNIPLAPERPESVDNGKTSAPARQQQPRKQQQQKQNQQEQQQQQQQQQKPQQPQIQPSPQPQQQKTSPALKTSVGEAEAKAQQPAQEKSDDRPIWKPWINSYDAGGNYEQVGGFPLGH